MPAEPAPPVEPGPPVGIDADGVTAWFERQVPGCRPPLEFELIAGGRSNLTYRVSDAAGAAWALRRPPVSHVLPTAHDMAREHRIISALGPTGFPVPATVGLCSDPATNGAPFYVMAFVDGLVLRDDDVVGALDTRARHRAGLAMADTLARLHAVDPDAVGLGDLARHDGYVERQLKRWHAQFEASTVEGVDTAGPVGAVHAALAASVPTQVGTSIVHGDFRLDNTVFAPDGTLLAVLDWELATLGDPLCDLGLLMVYWTEPDDPWRPLGVAPTACPGFPSRAEVTARYAEASGRAVSDLDYYVALGYWKLACILQGVYARYVGGAAGGDPTSVEGFARTVVDLADLAASALARSGRTAPPARSAPPARDTP